MFDEDEEEEEEGAGKNKNMKIYDVQLILSSLNGQEFMCWSSVML